MKVVTGIELVEKGEPYPSVRFTLQLRDGGKVVGRLPGADPVVWCWAVEIVEAGGWVHLSDLLPDVSWASYIPAPNG